MKILDRIFNRPAPRTFEVPVTRGPRGLHPELSAISKLRRRPCNGNLLETPPKRGMWITYQGKPGVLTNLLPGDIAVVMLVDPTEGTNVAEFHVEASSVQQAWFEEIPLGRRPPVDQARALGYHTRA